MKILIEICSISENRLKSLAPHLLPNNSCIQMLMQQVTAHVRQLGLAVVVVVALLLAAVVAIQLLRPHRS
jgi:hypothetical protein